MPPFVFWNLNLDQTISLSQLEFSQQQSLLLVAAAAAVAVIGLVVVEQVVFYMELPIP
jgi:hypothetical protein